MDQRVAVTRALEGLGLKVIFWNEPKNANGVDCWAQRPNGRPVSIEVKTAKARGGSWWVEPVTIPRRGDDLIAIVFPGGYVLIEPMADHLSACAPKGARSINFR